MKRMGKQTLVFAQPSFILGAATVVGPKEGQGPLKDTFDLVIPDSLYGEKTWEKAESKMLQEAVNRAAAKCGQDVKTIDFFLAGDLLNQNIAANFAARQLNIPFLGMYGACSTMVESLIVGAILTDGQFANTVVAAVSSHYDTAERQFRSPTELGTQRSMTAQWTVTGAGAFVLGCAGSGPRITHATIGKVVDMGIKDPNDMGSAMAPAAADTLICHLQDTGRMVEDYDLILTGDLATYGKTMTQQMVENQGYTLGNKYSDCGNLIYDPSQDTHAGGSGCACSAVVVGGYVLKEIYAGRYQRVLIIGTGALMSPTSLQQGESIPGIAHAVVIENLN